MTATPTKRLFLRKMHLNTHLFCLCFCGLCAFTALCVCGCAQAHPGEPDEANGAHFNTGTHEIQIKPRNRYISGHQYMLLRVKAARERMRIPVPAQTRTFYGDTADRSRSFSVGDTRDGFLIRGQPVPSPSLTMRQLPVQYERGIAYGTTALIRILSDTAETMKKKYPKTQMVLGNLGLKEGGDIPYSVSHNSGRDADIGFYLTDDGGNSIQCDNLYKINRKFKTIGTDAAYTFDLEKNTTLVETLLMHPDIRIQFIFVARHLRNAILRELTKRYGPDGGHPDPEILARFEQSVQNQSAHDDHFHIRIYCADHEICAGCVDRSVIHPWHEDPAPKIEKCVADHGAKLRSKKSSPVQKAAAIQRLALMNRVSDYGSLVLSALRSEDDVVRMSAATAAGKLGPPALPALARRFADETDEDVRAALLKTITAYHGSESRTVVHGELNSADIAEKQNIIHILSDFIVHYPDKSDLIPLWTAIRGPVTGEAFQTLAQTLEIVAVQPFRTDAGSEDAVREKMRAWIAENGEKSRRTWIIDGLKGAGYGVTDLSDSDIVQLLDAIDGPRAVSVNARLILKSISKLPQDSLSWSADDARWHYTRYFKRREKKYRIDLSDRDEHGRKP